jgi:hypothetical protein
MVSFEEAQKMGDDMHVSMLRKAAQNGFMLSSTQLSRFSQWDDEQNQSIRNKNNGRLAVGACGGQVTFEFTPTGIGLLVTARNSLTDESIDLSE